MYYSRPHMTEFEYSHHAMGTEVSLSIVHTHKDRSDALARMAESTVAAYEQRFSRFLPNSELSRLNAQKQLHVSPEFMDVTQTAFALYQKTRGYFNPLVQIARLGYTKNFDDLDETPSTTDAPYNIDFTAVQIDTVAHTITLQEGQKLDFGGVLKGYLAQKIAEHIMQEPGVSGVIVNIGGDIATRGRDAEGQRFVFSISNPVCDTEDITLTLENQSLATSGTYKRTWGPQKTTHHILDQTGLHNPPAHIVSASVVHPTGAGADAYTKAFIALRPDEARTLFTEEAFETILITTTGEVVHTTI